MLDAKQDFKFKLDEPTGMREKNSIFHFKKHSILNIVLSYVKGLETHINFLWRIMDRVKLAISTWNEQEYDAIQAVIDSGNFTMGKK